VTKIPGNAPKELVHFLTEEGYHPRSSSHGDAMCRFLLNDLYLNCSAFKAMANKGSIVHQANYTVNEGTPSRWTIDLVIGKSSGESPLPGAAIVRANPSEVWIAVDAKAIMTEHGKARRNRQRDLNSMADILHRMSPVPITGAYVVINMASRFRSPLREGPIEHKNIERMVAGTIPLVLEILQDRNKGRPGLDAAGVSVIDYTNLPGSKCRLVEDPPAPDSKSPLHYDNFLSKLCSEFTARFASDRI
jgi:hypothetical protein